MICRQQAKFILLISSFSLTFHTLQAQSKPASAAGEYLLEGVMETASGFQLKKDSSFNFFFSYGALDRFGEGRWSIKNGFVIFQSKPKPLADFRVTNSTPGTQDKISIQVKEMNPALLRHVFCRIKSSAKEQEGNLDQNGFIEFPVQPVDSLEILFEFCPEKRSVFAVNAKDSHCFEIVPEPWLMEIFFHNFPLQQTKTGLAGGHPLSDKNNFTYRKH